VIVGTDGIFLEAFNVGNLMASNFSLFIFDECHNVTGNSPMRRILVDFVNKQKPSPRVVGLTASFCNADVENAEKVRVKLESTMKAVIKQIE
jgi:ERCC4-related helicase